MDVTTWLHLPQRRMSLLLSKPTQRTPLLFKQSGQSLIETLLLAALLGAIWWLPATADGQTLVELFGHIANSSATHFRWVWSRFLLNPFVV